MKVVEKFVSINGEGTRAGELATFIRFKGCNLHCTYCDTKWANDSECSYEDVSPADIVEYIVNTNVKNVTLTGGEPLLQKEMNELLALLRNANVSVEVETNGSVPLGEYCGSNRPIFTMDYKTPSSGCEDKMCKENFSILNQDDTVKFVVGSIHDMDVARNLITEYHLDEKCNIYFSPVFGKIELVEMVDYLMKYCMNKVRIQVQLHKIIWSSDKRGV